MYLRDLVRTRKSERGMPHTLKLFTALTAYGSKARTIVQTAHTCYILIFSYNDVNIRVSTYIGTIKKALDDKRCAFKNELREDIFVT